MFEQINKATAKLVSYVFNIIIETKYNLGKTIIFF